MSVSRGHNRRSFAVAACRQDVMRTLLAPLWLALVLASSSSLAAGFPERPVHIVAPYAAGSSPDVLARLIAAPLSTALGQPVVIENKVGASGAIAMDAVAKARPDGYTLVLGLLGPMAILPAVRKDSPYQPADFQPVGLVAMNPFMLVVPADLPVTDVASLAAYARANPGKLNFASVGAGTPAHLAGELFNSMAGTAVTHIPVRSAYLLEVITGRVQMAFSPVQDALPHVRSGKLRGLAVTSPQRRADLPDIPTVAESGLPGFEVLARTGIAAPAGTPRDVVMRLNMALEKIVRGADVAAAIRATGATPAFSTPDAFGDLVASESRKWGLLARKIDLKLE
jgi:tripartite-type tricarboxylate transporter receptor subunit TctC